MDVKVSDAWIIHVERVSQRVHLCPWNGTQILDLVVAEVNFNIVYFQIACKNVSVVCQYVPSFRPYGDVASITVVLKSMIITNMPKNMKNRLISPYRNNICFLLFCFIVC